MGKFNRIVIETVNNGFVIFIYEGEDDSAATYIAKDESEIMNVIYGVIEPPDID